MAIRKLKKTTRKNKPQRRILLISVLLVAILMLVAALTARYTNTQNEFTKINDEIRQINASAGDKGRASSWCDGPNTVFPTTDNLDCGTTLELDGYDVGLAKIILEKLESLNYEVSESSGDELGNKQTKLQTPKGTRTCVIKEIKAITDGKTAIFVTCFAPSDSWLDDYERR